MEPLSPEEVRVLGCLAEKQLATPQHYPLTEAALVAACNQTTNRDPVVAYDQAVVRPALISLREQGLAKRLRRSGERVEKHAHRLDDTLGLAPGTLAVLTVLLLRGPQTPGELRSRSDRLHAFADGAALDAALVDLADRGLVEQLPRRPGEKQSRWRHLLAGDEPDEPAAAPERVEQPAVASGHAAPAIGLAGRAAQTGSAEAPRTGDAQPPVPSLRALAAEVAELRARVAALEAEFGAVPAEPSRPAPDPIAATEGPTG
jgi:uncharacterized protein